MGGEETEREGRRRGAGKDGGRSEIETETAKQKEGEKRRE